MNHQADQPSEATVHALVTRADGSQHDLGIIAAHYSNPLKSLWFRQVTRRQTERRIARFNATQPKD